MKKGSVVLINDPTTNSSKVIDVRRLFHNRVQAVLVGKHRMSFRYRYEVQYLGKVYRVGHIEKQRKYTA
jgi:hypothetical protein